MYKKESDEMSRTERALEKLTAEQKREEKKEIKLFMKGFTMCLKTTGLFNDMDTRLIYTYTTL